MKRIMLSVKPQYVAKILNREKTAEIRKNIPKCELPCEVCIYCTSHNNYKDSLYLADDGKYDVDYYIPSEEDFVLNGKVLAEFTLNKIDQFGYVYSPAMLINGYRKVENDTFTNEKIDYEKCCLSSEELMNYASDDKLLPKPIFALYIDDLKIYDKPKKLCEFKTRYGKVMQRPFQSWGYVENV